MKKKHLFSIVLSVTTLLFVIGVGKGNFYQPKTTLAREFSTQLKQVKDKNIFNKPVPLDSKRATQFLDIRGVGDSGMALTYEQPLKITQKLPEGGLASFAQRLDALDPSGKSYRGDLSFINWETVVGRHCNQFRGRPSPTSYAFVSHPANLVEAYRKGFNLIGLANNHSWDCPVGEDGKHGALVSSRHMTDLSNRGNNWLWHGVGLPNQKTSAMVKTMKIKGKSIKVAFASLYMGGACTYISCVEDKNTLLQSLRDSDADIRILSIHSWNSETQKQLVNTGRQFIKNYKGDIVFGHGPHVWKPLSIIQSNSGRTGVMFESLGNFIHPSLAPNRKDMIGRVLLDLETLQIRQIQAIPLNINGARASFAGSLPPESIPARNFTWKSIDDSDWRSGLNTQVRGVYHNLSIQMVLNRN